MKLSLIALAPSAYAACCIDAQPNTAKSITRCERVQTTPPRPTASVSRFDQVVHQEQSQQQEDELKKTIGTFQQSKSPFRSRRGLAYNDGILANSFGDRCKACSWGYNWYSHRGDLSRQYEFVPTLWGLHPDHTSIWEQNARDMIAEGSKAVFSFNEPDNAGQANLSPIEAAAGHQQYMNSFAGRVLVGAPSVSNSNLAGEGLEWLQQFMHYCVDNCKFDFCNVHWYDYSAAAETLFDFIEAAHRICGGRPVWLTEFGVLDHTTLEVDGFVRNTIPRLDKIDYLVAYSYFMVKDGMLMSGGKLSSYGELYAVLP